jgi:hypothetical protein
VLALTPEQAADKGIEKRTTSVRPAEPASRQIPIDAEVCA